MHYSEVMTGFNVLSACCRVLTATLGHRLTRKDADRQKMLINSDLTSLSREAGVLPLKINTCVCGLKMTTASSLKGFLFFWCHRGNGNDYKIKREEKSRELKQKTPPTKRTSFFRVHLHKQKDKCWHDHKNAQNTEQVGLPSCCAGISRPLLCSLGANFCLYWKVMSVSNSPQSTSPSSVLWSFPERFTYFKEMPYTTQAYREPLDLRSGQFPWDEMAVQSLL